MPGQVHVIDHPLVQHKLSLMRMKSTSTSAFRNLLGELSMLMAYEVTRDMPTQAVSIETPLARMSAPMLDGKKIVLISILRAGTGILDGMLRPQSACERRWGSGGPAEPSARGHSPRASAPFSAILGGWTCPRPRTRPTACGGRTGVH
jgi:hypothetical protein